MRKRLTVFLALLAAFSLIAAACSDDGNEKTKKTDGDAAYEYINDGQLTVATNLPATGFWDGDDVDEITGGFEYEMAKEIAKRLGLDGVKVVNVTFDSLVAGQAKGFDLALSQITITDDRAKVVDFSTPYFDGDQGVLVEKGTEVADLETAKGLQWGYQEATTAQAVLGQIAPDKEPRVYKETTELFTALQAGQIDAAMLDTTIVLAKANEDGGQTFDVVAQFKTGEQYGALFPKGSALVADVDPTIEEMRADGTLDALAEEWLTPAFGKDPTKVPVIQL